MFYKCNYCDPVTKKGSKPIKSIDSEIDVFLKDEKKKYYHLNCYKLHLQTRKKIADDEEIEKIANELLEKTRDEIKENINKDKFLKWIMEFYDGSLPSYFMLKLQKVRTGEHESVKEPIPYDILLDVYSHMERYLRKLALTKNIDSVSQRMNYDLAVVLGNYGDYKKYKRKQQQFAVEEKEVDRQIEVNKKVKSLNESDKVDTDQEFDITDIIDDLLL